MRRASTFVGGTPFYMAPEQAEGENVDHRADLYAFGVTLYQLLSGDVPFRDGDIAYHRRHTRAPDVRELVPDVPEALAGLVAALLEKTPDARPADANEAGAVLQTLV